jgi:hypothetical protein
MSHLKGRLLGIVIILIFVAITYVNWRDLMTSGSYSPKMAAFGPVGIIGGLFVLVFPTRAGKPATTADRILLIAVFVVGLLAGLINWYLMDPAFFGR